METNKPKSPFTRITVVDRDDAIAFLKKVGFAETPVEGEYARDSGRTTSQRGAGARYLTVVTIDEMIAAPKTWRQFVYRWSKKLAA